LSELQIGDRSVVTSKAVEAFQIEIGQGLGPLQGFGPEEQAKWQDEAKGFYSISGPMGEETRMNMFVILTAIQRLGIKMSKQVNKRLYECEDCHERRYVPWVELNRAA